MQIKMIWCGEYIPDKSMRCILHNKNFADSHGIPFELIRLPDSDLPMYESERKRFEIACEIPDLLYLDCDAILLSIPKFELTDKPYFHWYNKPEMQTFISGVFFVNNHCEYFRELIKEADEKVPLGRGLKRCNGWAQKLVRNKNWNIFPDESFEHFMYSYHHKN